MYTFGIHHVPVVVLTNRLAISVSGTTGPPCIIPYIVDTKVPKNKIKSQGMFGNNWGKQPGWNETKANKNR